MLTIKNELISYLKDILSYPVLSVYPKDRIVPVCIIQETSNLSVDYRETNTSEVVYRFSLYSTDRTELNNEINKLDEAMIALGFVRSNYNETDSEVIHSVTLSYEGVIRLEGDTVKIYRISY